MRRMMRMYIMHVMVSGSTLNNVEFLLQKDSYTRNYIQVYIVHCSKLNGFSKHTIDPRRSPINNQLGATESLYAFTFMHFKSKALTS